MSHIEDNTELLIQAAEKGDATEVQRLIPLSNPKNSDFAALRYAAAFGHTECVKLLIPVSDPGSETCYALHWAARGGHAQCVELLIPNTHPKNGNIALRAAAESGHPECVKLLIPIGNPKDYNSLALQLAALSGHTPCVELLYPVSDAIAALRSLKHRYPPKQCIGLEQYIEAEEAKRLWAVLVNEVGEGAAVRQHPQHKM